MIGSRRAPFLVGSLITFVRLNSEIISNNLLLFVGFFIAQIPNFQLDASSDSLVLEGDNNLRYPVISGTALPTITTSKKSFDCQP
jgi:hypothetical protein